MNGITNIQAIIAQLVGALPAMSAGVGAAWDLLDQAGQCFQDAARERRDVKPSELAKFTADAVAEAEARLNRQS